MIPDDLADLFGSADGSGASISCRVFVAVAVPVVAILGMLGWVVFEAGREYLRGK